MAENTTIMLTPAEQISIYFDQYANISKENLVNIEPYIFNIIDKYYGSDNYMKKEYIFYLNCVKQKLYPISCEIEFDLLMNNCCKVFNDGSDYNGNKVLYDHIVHKIKFFKDLKFFNNQDYKFTNCELNYHFCKTPEGIHNNYKKFLIK